MHYVGRINAIFIIFRENIKNAKKAWKGVKSIINVRNSNPSRLSCLNINNNLVTDPSVIATSFNEYFSTIADNIRKDIPPSSKHFSSFLKNPVPNSLFLFPTDDNEVLQCLSSLNTDKASDPFSIPSQTLLLVKQCIISTPLSNILNISFISGIFPTNLKTAKVIPVYKKGSTLELTNYRPISLLSNIDKVFGKLIYSRVYEFLKTNKVLYSEQYGFRKGYST